MLELIDLSKRYKKQIVFQDLKAEFDQGVTVLTGPSGVGKTTLLRLCATVEKPSSGHVLWSGQDIQKNKRQFRSILGYAPQFIDFPEDLSAMDFILHIGALKGLKAASAKKQALELFERIGLTADKDKQIGSFSGGMRRRLGLSQAFLGSPECLIIDEPTAELDPETAHRINELIFEVSAKTVVIMTTHLEASLKGFDYQNLHLSGHNSA